MNSFFEYYFREVDFDGKETAVCCPFPHKTTNGYEYQESHPSAHINLMKEVFHCKVCDEGLSETTFISRILGCSYETADRIKEVFRKFSDKYQWDKRAELSETMRKRANELGISDEILKLLNVRNEYTDDLSFPVFMYDKIMDIRTYRPDDRENKIKSKAGSMSGLVIPFDLWRDEPVGRWTVICAGEKDMAVARSHGLNAITLTGGEKALPAFINPFRNRKIAICYDNDVAGLDGAKSLAAYLQPFAAEVKVVTGFHQVCRERGEDITDFFVKYGKTKPDLIEYIKEAPTFTASEAKEVKRSKYPLITLPEATTPQYMGRMVQSNIQVIASVDSTFNCPSSIVAKKIAINSTDPRQNTMQLNQEKTWQLTEDTCQDILKLIDSNFNEAQVWANSREILGIPKSEKDVTSKYKSIDSVFGCSVTDVFDSATSDAVAYEYPAYSVHKRLESGKKYLVTYKLVPHPVKGRKNTMIIMDAEEANDSIATFNITTTVKEHLDKFRELEGTVSDRVETLTEMVKSFIGYNGYNQLIQAIDLSYHTVLEFDFQQFKHVRGYLDTLIVTESRIGKSSTALALQQLYNLGTFASLAGNSATIPGLVGGSNKVNGNFQTKAGLIPMNHKGLIIFEELAKCNANVIKELTDIRSSNQVRIARVSGSINLPALVRMITLTNTKSTSTTSKPINSYPFGINVLTELVGTPEDIARYDLCLVMGEQGAKDIDFDYQALNAFDREAYQTRIRWVWSRGIDKVKISNDVANYISKECKKLNEVYDSHIKIFGTEAWKKVARLAVAVAGYLVSTDEDYEFIIVEKEHVDWAVNYMKSIYDNPTFKLREFVANERMYTEINENGVYLLQQIFNKYTAGLLQLEKSTVVSKNILMASTGLGQDDYNKMMQRLTQGLFIEFDGYEIIPTPRFRKGMSMIDRNINVTRVGEPDDDL